MIGVNLLRCTLSAFECFVTVSANQPAYQTYTHFLPAYMEALCTQVKVSVIEPFHPLKYPTTEPLVTTNIPDVSVSFPATPSAELLERIRSEGGKDLNIKGTKVFLLYAPSSEFLRSLVASGAIRTTPAAYESVNIAALSSLNLIRKIFSCFLRTHQYPAFADTDHLELNEANWTVEASSGKRKATESEPGHVGKRTRTRAGATPVEDNDEDTIMDDAPALPSGQKIIYAIPPTKGISGWGDDTQLPANDGLFIRFVDETQNSERERVIIEVIVRYFLGCLGPNADACKAAIDKLKSDVTIILQTQVGRELAHIAKCIDIGIQSQARIFPVVSEGQYLGSALLGAGFQIHAYGSTYIPVSSIALQKQIEQAGSHRSSLQAIADIIESDRDEDGNTEVRNCKTSLELRTYLCECNTNNEERDKIVQLARGLRFKPRSLNVSVQNIVLALSLIENPSADFPSDFPIHPTKLFEQDRLSVIWGAFGDLAPTPNFPGGPTIDLTTTRDRPKHVGVRLIPLKDAIVDIQVIMSTKKFCGTSLSKRSGPFKDRIYTGVDGTRVIAAFSSAVGVVQAEGSKGKERAVANAGGSLFEDGF